MSPRLCVIRLCVISVVCLGAAGVVHAQVSVPVPDQPRRGSVELGGGLLWAGGFDVESLPALLTANAGNQAPAVTLFGTETRVGSIAGLQGRVGLFISSTVSLEAGVGVSRPIVGVRVFDDFEDAPPLMIEQTMTRYTFDGSILLHPRRWASAGGRATPFIIAGAGYLRELHEGRELVETGRSYHAGAGLRYWLTQGRRRLGLRGDALLVVRDGAYAGESRRPHAAVGATLTYLF